MKAIILCTGQGTGSGAGPGAHVSQPLQLKPKPMIPLLNKPLLELLVALLARHDFREIVVNTGNLANTIEDYFRDGARFGVELAYAFDGPLERGFFAGQTRGTAGALLHIHEHAGFCHETFAVLQGEVLLDLDLTELLRFHRAQRAAVTLALREVPLYQTSLQTVAVCDDTGRVSELQTEPPVTEAKGNRVLTGVCLLEPSVLDFIPTDVPFDLLTQLLPVLLAEDAPVYGLTLPMQWHSLGQLTDYYQVMQQALRGKINHLPLPGREVAPGVWVGLNTLLDLQHTTIVPPICIGGGSTIEPGCTLIGPSWIGAGCVIESGAHIEKSLVFDHTRAGFTTNARNLMLSGSYAVDSSGTVIDLVRSEMEWAVTDARQPRPELKLEHLLLQHEQMLREQHRSLFEILHH